MIRELCYYGNPILRTRCVEVADFGEETQAVIADLIDTLNSQPGWGLAAPQIGYNVRIFVINYTEVDEEGYPIANKSPRVFVNPKITILDDEPWIHSEGCLSVPKIYPDVERPWKIRIEAQDAQGKTFVEEHEGWMARPILHENDHLNGVLNIDRAPKRQRKELEPDLKKIRRKFAK